MCLKQIKRADTRPSIEGRRLDAPLVEEVKVAVATFVAVPGSVMLNPVPVLTAVSAAANLAAVELVATFVSRALLASTVVSTFRVNVTVAARRATLDDMAMPAL